MELGFFDVGIGYKFVRRPRAPRLPTAPKLAAPARRRRRATARCGSASPGGLPLAAAAPARPKGTGFRLTPYLGGGLRTRVA
jgi:hypothetical protein